MGGDSVAVMTATSTTPVQLFTDRADRFTTILEGAERAWDAPTPCEGWAVRDVVAHVIDTQREFLTRQGLEAGPVPDPADPLGAWRAHRARATDALVADGVAGRAYDGYFGPTTIGETMADFYGWDLVVHGGDVARATGQPWSVTDEEAEALLLTADGWGDALYGEGICAPTVDVPDGASATDRLLGRLGRDPHWQPPA